MTVPGSLWGHAGEPRDRLCPAAPLLWTSQQKRDRSGLGQPVRPLQ